MGEAWGVLIADSTGPAPESPESLGSPFPFSIPVSPSPTPLSSPTFSYDNPVIIEVDQGGRRQIKHRKLILFAETFTKEREEVMIEKMPNPSSIKEVISCKVIEEKKIMQNITIILINMEKWTN